MDDMERLYLKCQEDLNRTSLSVIEDLEQTLSDLMLENEKQGEKIKSLERQLADKSYEIMDLQESVQLLESNNSTNKDKNISELERMRLATHEILDRNYKVDEELIRIDLPASKPEFLNFVKKNKIIKVFLKSFPFLKKQKKLILIFGIQKFWEIPPITKL